MGTGWGQCTLKLLEIQPAFTAQTWRFLLGSHGAMGETKSSIYSRICSIESRSSNASLHLVFVRAFEQEDFSEFLNLVQGSFGGADELDVASATTALHRLARRWSREGPGLAGSDRSVRQTLDVLALLSR